MLAACGAIGLAACAAEVAPQSDPLPGAIRSSEKAHDIFLPLETRTIADTVPRRATLASLFDAYDLGSTGLELIDEVRKVFDPRRLRVGNPYRLVVEHDGGAVRRFEYHVDDARFLRVARADTGFDAHLVPYVQERNETAFAGAIDARNNSLVAAIDAGGENVMLAIMLAEVLSGEIDFNNDLRRGDRFELLFEKLYREDLFGGSGETSFSGYGGVLAVDFVNDGRRVQAFRFHVPGEPEAQYFDENGRSMKRLFLRSPFRFEPRVTSRFSYRRVHPVHGGIRPHLGVDYGAPTGTPIIAVANGTVVSASRSGGSGNMVRLRHTNGYETYYLHLSGFATGLRQGARVFQGQVIGFVGSTGLSTGPHLDYRMRKDGVFVNPLLEHRNLPPGDPVPAAHVEAFRATRDAVLERLASGMRPRPVPATLAN